jgi:Spy/CpxP family protein refolding chaperone
MPRSVPFVLALLILMTGCTASPESQPDTSPYAGEETRAIKALSAEEITSYRSGEGMGFAKAAELNHYPGPRHVLDLADDLHLSDDQRTQIQQAFDEMQAAAVALGEQIIAQEATLDALFAEGQAEADSIQTVLREIGALQADLRFVHLNAHLTMKDLLTDAQVAHYDQVRGYADDRGAKHDHTKMNH